MTIVRDCLITHPLLYGPYRLLKIRVLRVYKYAVKSLIIKLITDPKYKYNSLGESTLYFSTYRSFGGHTNETEVY